MSEPHALTTPAPEKNSRKLSACFSIRPLTVGDAEAISKAYAQNRRFLQRWEPLRPDSFYTVAGQQELIALAVAEQYASRSFFWILTSGIEIVGRISLTDVVQGAFQNGNLGYWIADDHQGKGLATAAARFVCDYATTTLGLHRLQAGTLEHNLGSQKVLTRCGFTSIGMAQKYIQINGQWQDHILFQRILHA